jgi:hypothetical protein
MKTLSEAGSREAPCSDCLRPLPAVRRSSKSSFSFGDISFTVRLAFMGLTKLGGEKKDGCFVVRDVLLKGLVRPACVGSQRDVRCPKAQALQTFR